MNPFMKHFLIIFFAFVGHQLPKGLNHEIRIECNCCSQEDIRHIIRNTLINNKYYKFIKILLHILDVQMCNCKYLFKVNN